MTLQAGKFFLSNWVCFVFSFKIALKKEIILETKGNPLQNIQFPKRNFLYFWRGTWSFAVHVQMIINFFSMNIFRVKYLSPRNWDIRPGVYPTLDYSLQRLVMFPGHSQKCLAKQSNIIFRFACISVHAKLCCSR